MPDEADFVQALAEREEATRQRERDAGGYEIPPGVAGECELCGEFSPRLIGGACAPCRDKREWVPGTR